MKPTVVFVGGFLGAGKTTLILAAARELKRRGMRCAAILNDQSDALVDTELAAAIHEITLNLRALGEPAGIMKIVEWELERLDGCWKERAMRCFRPAAPQPERRMLREEIAALH